MHKQWQEKINTALDVYGHKLYNRKIINPRYISSIEISHDTDTLWVHMTSSYCVQLKFQAETPPEVLVDVASYFEALMLNS